MLDKYRVLINTTIPKPENEPTVKGLVYNETMANFDNQLLMQLTEGMTPYYTMEMYLPLKKPTKAGNSVGYLFWLVEHEGKLRWYLADIAPFDLTNEQLKLLARK